MTFPSIKTAFAVLAVVGPLAGGLAWVGRTPEPTIAPPPARTDRPPAPPEPQRVDAAPAFALASLPPAPDLQIEPVPAPLPVDASGSGASAARVEPAPAAPAAVRAAEPFAAVARIPPAREPNLISATQADAALPHPVALSAPSAIDLAPSIISTAFDPATPRTDPGIAGRGLVAESVVEPAPIGRSDRVSDDPAKPASVDSASSLRREDSASTPSAPSAPPSLADMPAVALALEPAARVGPAPSPAEPSPVSTASNLPAPALARPEFEPQPAPGPAPAPAPVAALRSRAEMRFVAALEPTPATLAQLPRDPEFATAPASLAPVGPTIAGIDFARSAADFAIDRPAAFDRTGPAAVAASVATAPWSEARIVTSLRTPRLERMGDEVNAAVAGPTGFEPRPAPAVALSLPPDPMPAPPAPQGVNSLAGAPAKWTVEPAIALAWWSVRTAAEVSDEARAHYFDPNRMGSEKLFEAPAASAERIRTPRRAFSVIEYAD